MHCLPGILSSSLEVLALGGTSRPRLVKTDPLAKNTAFLQLILLGASPEKEGRRWRSMLGDGRDGRNVGIGRVGGRARVGLDGRR